MSSLSLEARIVQHGEKSNIEQLQNLIGKTSAKALTDILNEKFGCNDCISFWNYLLLGFDARNIDAIEKRFTCVKCFLSALQTIEFSYRQTYDLITRLCQDLSSFPSEQLVVVLEYCIDGIRIGDPKCVGWKDLLPETLSILAAQQQVVVNSITMSGREHRSNTVRNLCTMRWVTEILTPIAGMFRELKLADDEVATVLNKFSGSLQGLAPMELPALAYQLFSMCSTAAQIIVPILAFEKYFHRYYYKKLFADMMSNTTDFDSIDSYSDKELLEAEETILHHLNYCTQYKISELQMSVVLRNFISLPDVILTPFVLSALLSMTTANREPDSQLVTSVILPLLCKIIKNNEDERALADASVWCRDSLQRKHVDLLQIFAVLIDQNKDGKDVVTPGLVNLAFVMLKTKQSDSLNQLAIAFLVKFIRKRFVFGRGIVSKLAEWMIIFGQHHFQFGECLTVLSVADTFTVSECVDTIKHVMDYFLHIPGEHSIRMMSFILPILKISACVRDAFIDVLRKAMHSSHVKKRSMAVYGFCMVLKQLNNSNSQRSQFSAAGICTQHSLSGFSIMSQMTLGSRNYRQRHFDMLTLEIIGQLRTCFSQPLDIKCTLYENLQRAVELNPMLVPHVLQFIDWHFRSHFIATASTTDADIEDFSVKFDKIVHASDDNASKIEVSDNLGRLIIFVANCLVIFAEFEGEYDTREMRRLLDSAVEKVCAKDLKFEDNSAGLMALKSELIAQQMNFIEGLMAYTLAMSKQTNDNVKNLLPLFREHQKLSTTRKSLTNSKSKKKKANDASEASSSTIINGVAVKRVNTPVANIWDLNTIEKLLRLLHEDVVPFAAAQNTQSLRAHVELVRYVLEVAAVQVEAIRLEPQYKQLAHSQRTLKYLTDITKVVYERCIRRLPELWRDFDLKTAALAATCFKECLITANTLYKKKFTEVFLKGFDFYVINSCKQSPAVLHDVIDAYMKERDASGDSQSDELSEEADGRRIPSALLQCLEVFYENITYENRLTIDSYMWLLNFCKEHIVHDKELGLVHKLLFAQRQKTHSGAFFNMIALQLSNVLGFVTDPEEIDEEIAPTQTNVELRSITGGSAESCLAYLFATMRKQIDDVEHFIVKANNLNFKYRVAAEEDRDMYVSGLRSLQRSICSQLIHIGNALVNLSNVSVPLGACVENSLKILMQLYICLKNLAKHFLNCCAVMKLQIQTTKFDLLLHVVGKRLPANAYRLITYIEANIIDANSKKSNPQLEKARVLRETKLIPKLVLCVENFNKHVMLLSNKTSDRLRHFLHFGVVRDFRVKTSELKAAIERSLSHSDQIEVDPSETDDENTEMQRIEAELAAMDGPAVESDEITVEEIDENRRDEDDLASTASSSVAGAKKRTGDTKKGKDKLVKTPKTSKSTKNTKSTATTAKTKTKAKKGTKSTKSTALDIDEDDHDDWTTPEDGEVLAHESEIGTEAQVFKNLAKINTKAKKRSLLEAETTDQDVLCAPPIAKKRRGRSSIKR